LVLSEENYVIVIFLFRSIINMYEFVQMAIHGEMRAFPDWILNMVQTQPTSLFDQILSIEKSKR
jgi:hypothetical protein